MSENVKSSILCVGQIVADIVVRPVDALPPGSRADLVENIELISGGCAANTASVLAKLGAPVALAGLIGCDALGEAVMAELSAVGIQITSVARDAALPTSTAIVLVQSSGERSFFYRNGGNERFAEQHVSDDALQAVGLVHIGGAMKLLELDLPKLAARAKAFGCRISLDTDWDVHGSWMRKLGPVLPQLDYLITNEEEAAMLTGERDYLAAARTLLAAGPQIVLVKRGELGLTAVTRSEIIEMQAHRVKVLDTTCAGDSAAAGFVYGMSRNWSLEESAELANATGALATTQLSHWGVVSLADTERFRAA